VSNGPLADTTTGEEPEADFEAQVDVLRYTVEGKAWLYRPLMRILLAAREQFVPTRRVSELTRELRALDERYRAVGEDDVEAALAQLQRWGNVHSNQDHSGARSLAEWRRRRLLWQISSAGMRAEQHLGQLLDELSDRGSLQRVALRAVQEKLDSLAALARAIPLDGGKLRQVLVELRADFDNLTENAAAFLISVGEALDATTVDVASLQAYKAPLLNYLETFINELARLGGPISRAIVEVQRAEPERLFEAASAIEETPLDDPERGEERRFAQQWAGVVAWFVGTPVARPSAEALKDEARSAVHRLMALIDRIADSGSGRLSRRSDLVALARRFQALESEEDAHRLFKAAFGLYPTRHLAAVSESDADEDRLELPRNSWWDGYGVDVPVQLRQRGRFAGVGRTAAVEDLAEARALLRAHAQREREEQERALARLLSAGTCHLSQLTDLDRRAFRALVDILRGGLERMQRGESTASVRTRDGAHLITLLRPADVRPVVVHSEIGDLQLPDYHLEVRSAAPQAEVASRA